MIEHEINRGKGHRIPMLESTRSAMLEYINERIVLLDAAAEIAPKYRLALRRGSSRASEIVKRAIEELGATIVKCRSANDLRQYE